MVSLTVVFWMYVILFAIIGAMRGWAKELLVSFAVILSLTFSTLMMNYVVFLRDTLPDNSPLLFWLRSIILMRSSVLEARYLRRCWVLMCSSRPRRFAPHGMRTPQRLADARFSGPEFRYYDYE